MKISENLIPLAYSISRKVYENKLSNSEGKNLLSTNNQMNPNSAADYINNFKCLMEGNRFTRTLNASSMQFFLEHIFNDFGESKLSNALSALKQHIEYYESIQKSKVRLHKMRGIYDKYLVAIPIQSIDEKEQNEINYYYKEALNRNEILNELRDLKETDPEIIVINHKAYKRDNKTITQIKILRKFECQICGTSILKKDGTKYVEAAHIKAKNKKGRETPDNIILLCPNHHKEFDLGSLEIISHTISDIEFSINGRLHKLSLLLQ
jgi:5-methylcytosine-specific restriction enzyme A